MNDLKRIYQTYKNKYKYFPSYSNFLSLFEDENHLYAYQEKKKYLAESNLFQGVIEHFNDPFKNIMVDIANDILNIINSPDLPMYDCVLEENSKNEYLFKCYSTKNTINQISNIVILLKFDAIDDAYDFGYANTEQIIFRNGKKLVYPAPQNKKLDTECIVLIINPNTNYSVKKIYSILMHELHHAFMRLYLETPARTHDLIKAEVKYDALKNQQIDQNYFFKSTLDAKEYFANIGSDTLYLLFLENAYFLNKDEIQARQENIAADINNLKIYEYNLFKNDNYSDEDILEKISEQFRMYSKYIQLFNRIRFFVPLTTKNKFETEYLNDLNSIYDKTFKNFDDFINFNISHFVQLKRHSLNLLNKKFNG